MATRLKVKYIINQLDMKKILLVLSLAFFSISIFAKDIQELVVTTIPPMSCQNCENKIKKGDLRFEKGIKRIETNLAEQRVTIEYDADKTDPAKIEEAFHKIGYNVEILNSSLNTESDKNTSESSASKSGCDGSCCKTKAE